MNTASLYFQGPDEGAGGLPHYNTERRGFTPAVFRLGGKF
jgi:hypothetical protein